MKFKLRRAHLDALHAAGFLDAVRHATAVADLAAGGVELLPRLDLHVGADAVRLDVAEAGDPGDPDSTAILSGTVARYEELVVSHGMILHTGSLRPRTPLSRVKMLRDHNHGEPIGFMTTLDEATLDASFAIAPNEVDRVAYEFAHKLRDGLSVGFGITNYEIDDEWILHVYEAELYEVSVCAIPAIPDAGIQDVAASAATTRKETLMNRAALDAALAAGTITAEQHAAAVATLDALGGAIAPAPAPAVPLALAAGPDHDAAGTATASPRPTPISTVDRGLSLRDVSRTLAESANRGDRNGFALALADIIPADDAGAAFLREDWTGEAWRLDETSRAWIDAFGTPAEMTAINGKGWEWGTADVNGDGGEPLVDEYAGNKTEVPTNEIGTAPKTYNGFRIAAGWDVDRVFEDFASEEFWDAFWPAVMRDYKRKSNAGIRTRVLAKVTAGANVTAGGALATIKTLHKDIRPYGRMNRLFLGDVLFDEISDMKVDDLPVWLRAAEFVVDIAEGTADAGKFLIVNDPDLADNKAVGFDSRAATVRERAPFRVEAVNVGRGGIDVGIYSYLRLDDHESRAIRSRDYVAA